MTVCQTILLCIVGVVVVIIVVVYFVGFFFPLSNLFVGHEVFVTAMATWVSFAMQCACVLVMFLWFRCHSWLSHVFPFYLYCIFSFSASVRCWWMGQTTMRNENIFNYLLLFRWMWRNENMVIWYCNKMMILAGKRGLFAATKILPVLLGAGKWWIW